MEAELFHADGQRVTTKLTVAFRNSANAPKKTQIKFGANGCHHYVEKFQHLRIKDTTFLSLGLQWCGGQPSSLGHEHKLKGITE